MSPKQCPRCLWSGKYSQLLTQDDDDCQFEYIPATRFKPGKVYNCFCCSLLSGLFECQGVLGRPGALVVRDDNRLLLRKDETEEFRDTLVFTSSAGGAAAQLPFLPHRPMISCDTSSTSALNWVRKKIDSCLSSHRRCENSEGGFLPTRLISVRSIEGSRDVRLVNSAELPSSVQYIALSHCWGTLQMQCLTKIGNLAKQMEQISWTSLTRTFQDAIDFTRRLGIEYIWIDSLCIIQGDPQDWAKEASKMFSVYHNALVTLAGVHASDGSGGLYSKGSLNQTAFPRPVTYKGKKYDLYTHDDLPPFHDWRRLPDDAPLFTRAWCYQERMIAPRVVYFTKQEVLWECFGQVACECGGESFATDRGTIADDNPKMHHIAAFEDDDALRAHIVAHTAAMAFYAFEAPSPQSRGLTAQQSRREYCVKQWHNVVEQYSKLKLFKYIDRLPAIGTIAEHYCKNGARTGEDYFAGLWSGSLTEDLMWNAKDIGGKRLDASVAPSWSWASVRCAVEFYPVKKILVNTISAVCCYEMGSAFGTVSSGKLILEGPTLALTLHEEAIVEDETDASSEAFSTALSSEGLVKMGWSLKGVDSDESFDTQSYSLDEDPMFQEGQSVYAVACAQKWNGHVVSLLVTENMLPELGPCCYRRVGLLIGDAASLLEVEQRCKQMFVIV